MSADIVAKVLEEEGNDEVVQKMITVLSLLGYNVQKKSLSNKSGDDEISISLSVPEHYMWALFSEEDKEKFLESYVKPEMVKKLSRILIDKVNIRKSMDPDSNSVIYTGTLKA